LQRAQRGTLRQLDFESIVSKRAGIQERHSDR
jgi:hypothetical protein